MSVDSFYIPKKTELCSGTYTYRGDIPDIEISQENLSYIAGFTFLLGLQAILLNMYVLGYYREKRDGVFPLYYFITTLSNSVLGLDAVLHTLLLVLYVIYSPADTSSSQRLFNYLIFITYTLTSTARNSKLVYNTILISMRAVKYCSPSHVFSRKTSAAVILLFPIAWMLFLASTLTFHFALPAEVNMQQYIYFPEPNANFDTKAVSLSLLYILPLSIILTSLGVCLHKRRQKHSSNYIHKLKAEQQNRTVVQQPTYGQSKVTDIALTVLLLVCYLPYVGHLLVDIAYSATDGNVDEVSGQLLSNSSQEGMSEAVFVRADSPGRGDCTTLFMTGVVLPFINSAFDPVIFIIYNAEMSARMSMKLRAAANTCRKSRKESAVRFNIEPRLCMMPRASGQRTGSMCTSPLKRWDEQEVIEYKESDTESDSSLESFEYQAKKHKSRRYRRR